MINTDGNYGLAGNEVNLSRISVNNTRRIPSDFKRRKGTPAGLILALLLALALTACGGGSTAEDSPAKTDNTNNNAVKTTISSNAPWIRVKNQRFTITPPSAFKFDQAKTYTLTLDSKACVIETDDITVEKIIARCPEAVTGTEKVGMVLKEGETTFPAIDLTPVEPKILIKIDNQGYPLADQSQNYDAAGSEAAGTKWSCVLLTSGSFTLDEAKNVITFPNEKLLFPEESTTIDKDTPSTWLLWQAATAPDPDLISNDVFAYTNALGSTSPTSANGYVMSVNGGGAVCGKTSWELPKATQIAAVNKGLNRTISLVRDYFNGNNLSSDFWTSTAYPNNNDLGWKSAISTPKISPAPRTFQAYVLLVHIGQ